MNQSAVSETAKRVHEKALDLLTQRDEINRRIRCLQQVMQALRDLPNSSTFNGSNAAAPTPACATERKKRRNNGAPRERTIAQMDSFLPGRSKHIQAGLTRACRIALMEAGGTASTDEIHSRILRRESFSFADSGFANAAIGRTLNAMTNRGEVQRREVGPQSLWQRIVQSE